MRRSIGHPIWFGDSDPVKAAMLILADETIIFATLDAIALLWLCLKLLVTHWTDSPHPPKKRHSVRKAA